MIETDNWPFIAARHFTRTTAGTRRRVRLIVVHDMEAPEKGETAEAIARYFRDLPAAGPVKASAHVCIDNDSIVQCVRDNDVAFAAPGANSDGLQLELAGYGKQTRAQWLDDYSRAVIDNAANVAAQYGLKYDIPMIHLTDAQLADGVSRGIIGHDQASRVFKKSDHTDPGPNFPWDHFLARAAEHIAARRALHQDG